VGIQTEKRVVWCEGEQQGARTQSLSFSQRFVQNQRADGLRTCNNRLWTD